MPTSLETQNLEWKTHLVRSVSDFASGIFLRSTLVSTLVSYSPWYIDIDLEENIFFGGNKSYLHPYLPGLYNANIREGHINTKTVSSKEHIYQQPGIIYHAVSKSQTKSNIIFYINPIKSTDIIHLIRLVVLSGESIT